MAGSGPHQTSSHHVESTNVCQQDELHDLKREKDLDNCQEGSLQTLHIGGSDYRRKGHAVNEQGDEKAMQREIDDLKRLLRRAQRKQSPPNSNVSSNDKDDTIYKQRLGTPPSESFSCEEEHIHKRKRNSPSHRGLGNDVMKKALS